MPKDYFGEMEPEEEEYKRPSTRTSNYEGQRYCRWLIVKKIKGRLYLCRCDCGHEQVRDVYLIKRQSIECNKCYKKSKRYKLFKSL